MIYRDDEQALRARRNELAVERARELAEVPLCLRYLRADRVARIAAAGVGIVAVVAMAVMSAADIPGATWMLALSWPAMLAVWVLVGQMTARQDARVLHRTYTPTEDVGADVERLDVPVARFLSRRAAGLERASIALPLMARCLLLPLTIHLGVYAGIAGMTGHGVDIDGFNRWIALSLLIVGHCHLVLVYLSWRFARVAGRSGGVGVDDQGWLAWWIAIVASVLSGLVLVFFMPYAALALVFVVPGLVTTTGLVFIPLLFARAARRIRHERALLG